MRQGVRWCESANGCEREVVGASALMDQKTKWHGGSVPARRRFAREYPGVGGG
jgi:hypothetical protein